LGRTKALVLAGTEEMFVLIIGCILLVVAASELIGATVGEVVLNGRKSNQHISANTIRTKKRKIFFMEAGDYLSVKAWQELATNGSDGLC
jgi:hypothetical protein